MAGGPTRTSWLCHGERRPTRHGVNTYVELLVTLWPIHPEGFVFVLFIEDTLWPTHPVRFFSALSLEKNAPSESASVMYLVEAWFL